MPSYTTDGPVRGTCGHHHRTIATAYCCLQKDARGCARQGGYTDRGVMQITPQGQVYPLDAEEREALAQLADTTE